jgi:hypothetical protein
VDPNVWEAASEEELVPKKIFGGSTCKLAYKITSVPSDHIDLSSVIAFESSMLLTATDFAVKNKKSEHNSELWDGFRPNFVEQLDQVNSDLSAAGMPIVSSIKTNKQARSKL